MVEYTQGELKVIFASLKTMLKARPKGEVDDDETLASILESAMIKTGEAIGLTASQARGFGEDKPLFDQYFNQEAK